MVWGMIEGSEIKYQELDEEKVEFEVSLSKKTYVWGL